MESASRIDVDTDAPQLLSPTEEYYLLPSLSLGIFRPVLARETYKMHLNFFIFSTRGTYIFLSSFFSFLKFYFTMLSLLPMSLPESKGLPDFGLSVCIFITSSVEWNMVRSKFQWVDVWMTLQRWQWRRLNSSFQKSGGGGERQEQQGGEGRGIAGRMVKMREELCMYFQSERWWWERIKLCWTEGECQRSKRGEASTA